VIIGDYDVDGICASHELSQSIHSIFPEKKIKVRIPRRFSEGYGINHAIADEIITTMPKGTVVITVDNGIAAGEVIKRIKNAGFTVLVTDHHEAKEGIALPEADMLIDPAVESIPNPLTGRYWCGAGVVYKLCEPIISESLSQELSTYAALATVADVMELKEGNWGLVRNALKLFKENKAPKALTMLLNSMNQDATFCNEDSFGFYLGPAFNAPGRLQDNGAANVLRYLYNPTQEGAEHIIQINERRKQLAEEETALVNQIIINNHQENECPLWVYAPNLHEGIVGIIAGRIAEQYQRPAIIVTDIEQQPGMVKGSGRSYGTFNLFEYLSNLPDDIFTKMGGHKGAAGLSLSLDKFEKAKTYQIPLSQIENEIDNTLISMDINSWEIPGIYNILNKFRPFGQGNSTPEFKLEVDSETDKFTYIGNNKNHLAINADRYKIMHFNHIPNELSNPEHFGMKGHIGGNVFRGIETPQFIADEVYDIQDTREYEGLEINS